MKKDHVMIIGMISITIILLTILYLFNTREKQKQNQLYIKEKKADKLLAQTTLSTGITFKSIEEMIEKMSQTMKERIIPSFSSNLNTIINELKPTGMLESTFKKLHDFTENFVTDVFENSSLGSNLTSCSKEADFKVFGIDSKYKIRITQFGSKTWSATGTASVIKSLGNILPLIGTTTSTTTVTNFNENNWTGTTTSTASIAGSTTTTTSTITIAPDAAKLGIPFMTTGTTTTTTSSGGVTTTTTTTTSINIEDMGGTATSTSTSTSVGGGSGITTTTTTTTTTFKTLKVTEEVWVAYFTSTSTTTSSGGSPVTTTGTTTAHIMAVKQGDWWKGSLSINTATASNASSHTDSLCYNFTLPYILNPVKGLRRIWELIAITWNGLLKLSSNHINILGLMTHTIGCDK